MEPTIQSQILQWALTVLVPTLIIIAVRVANVYAAKIKDDRLRAIALDLVAWAEQTYGSGQGAAKLAAVSNRARTLGTPLESHSIEAAVYTLKSTQPQAAIAAAPAGVPTGGQ